jgi:transposase
LRALGHEVRLMPAQYVKAYVKRNKNDAADAAAICEAVMRPTMRFVPIKPADQQAAVLLHRGRERLVRQCTGLGPGIWRSRCWMLSPEAAQSGIKVNDRTD